MNFQSFLLSLGEKKIIYIFVPFTPEINEAPVPMCLPHVYECLFFPLMSLSVTTCPQVLSNIIPSAHLGVLKYHFVGMLLSQDWSRQNVSGFAWLMHFAGLTEKFLLLFFPLLLLIRHHGEQKGLDFPRHLTIISGEIGSFTNLIYRPAEEHAAIGLLSTLRPVPCLFNFNFNRFILF